MSKKKTTPEEHMALVPDEAAFYQMFEKDPEIMLLIEPDSGIIVDANPVAVEFYRYSKATLCGMSIEEINTMSHEQVAAERRHALHEERNYFVFPHRLANGDERIVEVYSSPIVLHGQSLLFSIIHDITGLRHSDVVWWR